MNFRTEPRCAPLCRIETLESRFLLSATPTMDMQFGDSGEVFPGVVSASGDLGTAISVESDGKIVIATEGTSTLGSGMTVLRLNADGSPDNTFGASGSTLLPDGLSADVVYVQSDGKILIAGSGSPWATSSELIRLNVDGSVDESFGTSGRVNLPMRIQAIDEAPQGGILVAGASGAQLGVAHLNSDGSLDSSFGTAGIATFDGGDGRTASASGATILMNTPDGKVVVVGSMDSISSPQSGWVIARLNSDGSVDPAFNGGKPVQFAQTGSYAVASDARLLPDGTILVAGQDTSTLTLVRYNFDGSIDASFGTSGIATDSLGPNFMTGPMKLQVRQTGEIVVEGFGTDFAYNGHFTPTGTLLQSETTPIFGPDAATTPTPLPAGLAINLGKTGALDPAGDLVAANNTPQADGTGWIYPLVAVRLNLDDYTWAGDPSFQWTPYPQSQPPAPTLIVVPITTPATPTVSAPTSLSAVVSQPSSTPDSPANDLTLAREELGADTSALRVARRHHAKHLGALQNKIRQDHSIISSLRHAITVALARKKA
jgi:uncharacterized delta-60 repeat protein